MLLRGTGLPNAWATLDSILTQACPLVKLHTPEACSPHDSCNGDGDGEVSLQPGKGTSVQQSILHFAFFRCEQSLQSPPKVTAGARPSGLFDSFCYSLDQETGAG